LIQGKNPSSFEKFPRGSQEDGFLDVDTH